jgi:TonB family protein
MSMRLARFVLAICLLSSVLSAEETALERAARAGRQAVYDRAYTTAVYFLKDVVTADPQHPAAWKFLCRAYLALGQVDAAIDACRKQIDAHPDTRDVYGTLGQALWQKGQRDEAIDAFRRQIDISPRDISAYGDLGRSYCELGRYEEAVPVLEKAVAMHPYYDVGQASLGDAHLGLGHIDQGLAILNKLAQDQSRPDALNRVAYILASHRVGLDLAQQYAEGAVTGAATELQERAEQAISTSTLQFMVSLAKYWDTLGWVHFQRGNLDAAEKFIAAAWSANPDGPVGDHLVQIYQRRGQKPPSLAAHPIPAGKLFAEKASADFYVVQAQKPPLAEVRFIRGDESLRPFTKAVQDRTPTGVFPDVTPAKLVRRVTLTCPGEGRDCSIDVLTASAAVFAELNAIPPNTQVASEPLPEKPGVYRAGGGVTPPVPTYSPPPEYSEEARKAKYQGTVVLKLEVDPTGHTRNIQVVRSLGMGLDEKAIEAVNKWEFRPGIKDGKPVTVTVSVEVNFRLMTRPSGQ